VFFAAFSIVSEIDGQMERSLHLIAWMKLAYTHN
jgi:hypothetical protein